MPALLHGPASHCENQTAGGVDVCYKRDYDLLGYRYALMSNLATAGLNIVACMLPARDEAEFTLFPPADVEFIASWLNWTDAHIAALANTVPLPVRADQASFLGPPSPATAL